MKGNIEMEWDHESEHKPQVKPYKHRQYFEVLLHEVLLREVLLHEVLLHNAF